MVLQTKHFLLCDTSIGPPSQLTQPNRLASSSVLERLSGQKVSKG